MFYGRVWSEWMEMIRTMMSLFFFPTRLVIGICFCCFVSQLSCMEAKVDGLCFTSPFQTLPSPAPSVTLHKKRLHEENGVS